MKGQKSFQLKDAENQQVRFSGEEIQEIVPDADMRFSLVVLKSGDKHFVYGSESEILAKLGS